MKRAPITKGQAIRDVAILCRPERPPTKGEFQRLIHAFETLSLTPFEMHEAFRLLGLTKKDGTFRNNELDRLAPWRGSEHAMET